MDGIVAELKKIPPITRLLCASSLAVTLPVLSKIVSPYRVVFLPSLIFKQLEIWRLYTSFFLGSGGINYLFEFFMLYRNADELERGAYRSRSGDLAWQLIFVCGSIMVVTIPLNAFVLTRPFLVSLVYLSSSLAPPGAQTSLFGLVTFPVKYFPYVLIGLDFLMGGPGAAASSLAGAVVGHGWWLSVWGGALGSQGVLTRFGQAPEWMKKLVGNSSDSSPPPAAGGEARGLSAAGIHVTAPRRPGTDTGGHKWGSGQRLGD